MGGDNSRLSEGRAVWSAVRMQRAREKFWDQTKKVGTDTATQHKSIPIDLPLGLTSACAEKNNYNFEEVRHNFYFFLFFSFLVVRDRSEISGNYFDFASLLPPLVQKGKRNKEIHTFSPPASRRMNAQFLSNRVSYLLFPSLRLDFFFLFETSEKKKKTGKKMPGFHLPVLFPPKTQGPQSINKIRQSQEKKRKRNWSRVGAFDYSCGSLW